MECKNQRKSETAALRILLIVLLFALVSFIGIGNLLTFGAFLSFILLFLLYISASARKEKELKVTLNKSNFEYWFFFSCFFVSVYFFANGMNGIVFAISCLMSIVYLFKISKLAKL